MNTYSFSGKIIIVLISLAFASCSKSFTELAPISNANTENFYKTQADFDLAINAAMNTLYGIYAPEGPISYTGELMGDNTTLYIIAGNQTDKHAFRDYNVQISNSLVYSFWRQFYSSLFSVNTVLDKIAASDLDANFKEQVQAKMRFLRGLYYFNMVRLWGGVPIVSKVVSGAESYSILRSTQEEVYKFIEDDLLFAESKLPIVTDEKIKGRPTKGAVQALLGEMYLSMGDKAKAATVLLKVYNSALYQLLPSYASLWGPIVKNTKESIFEIQYAPAGGTGIRSPYCQSFYPNVNVLGFSGVGMNQITDDLYNEYENADPRRDITVSLGFQSGGIFQPQKFCQKWADYAAQISGSSLLANNEFVLYRFADVLLMLTEATNDPQYLNMVRSRAGLPLWGTPNYPIAKYPTLALALEHENRVESAVEFKRWFQLKRTNRAVALLTSKGKAATADKMLLPIPDNVRLQNKAITQNAGYQ